MELYVFGDVLEVVYVFVIYLRVVCEDGRVFISFVMFKIWVVFVRKIIFLCLELMVVVIMVRFCIYVKGVIDCVISCIVCWIDNFLILYWIRGVVL